MAVPVNAGGMGAGPEGPGQEVKTELHAKVRML